MSVTDLMRNRVLITHFPSQSLEEDPVHARPQTPHRTADVGHRAAAITPGRAGETVFDSCTLGVSLAAAHARRIFVRCASGLRWEKKKE